MLKLAIIILSSFGLTWIVVSSKIFKRLREYLTMNRMLYAPKNNKVKAKYYIYWVLESVTNCYGCFGFWGGMICYLLYKYGFDIILYGFICSGIAVLLNNLIKK